MTKKSILILAAIVIATSWTLLRPGLFQVHDYIHAARSIEVLRAVQDGHFPVRWTQNFGYGYGMPLFEFYAPLPFYWGALMYWFGFSSEWVVKSQFFIPNLLTTLGAFFLGKKIWNERAGWLAAALITLAPYRAVNLFVRGAVGEAWGMMMMPWIILFGLEFLERTPNQKKQPLISLGLVISLWMLMTSHNLTTLMFAPVSFGLLAMVAIKQNKWELPILKLAKLTGHYLLAGGLAAFYLLPALLEKDFTQIESILSGYFHYSHHFLYIRQFFNPIWGYGGSAWGPDDEISFFLGWAPLLTLGIIVVSMGWNLFKAKPQLKISFWTDWAQKYFWQILLGFTLAVCLLLSLRRSLLIWDVVPLISFIQFPWRWLGVGTFILGLLGASLAEKSNKLPLLVLGLVALSFISTSSFRPENYYGSVEDVYYTQPEKIRRQMSDILPDYLPAGFDRETLEPSDSLIYKSDEFDGELTVQTDRAHQKLIAVSAEREQKLTLAVADYPGWRMEINGEPTEYKVSDTGLINIEVDQNTKHVGLIFGATPVRQISDLVSLGSTLILLYFILLPFKSRFHQAAKV